MDEHLKDLPTDELTKLGNTAGRLVLGRKLADLLYGFKARLPGEDLAQLMDEYLNVLDQYIDWHVDNHQQELLKAILQDLKDWKP